MTNDPDMPAAGPDDAAPDAPPDRGALLRWFVSAAALSVPQAAGPVAFSLLALSLTGQTSGGAALILVMTLAQVAGAIPITRLGKGFSAARFLQALVLVRTLALGLMALIAASGVPFAWMFLCAAIAGSVSGAAYGYLRSILNSLTPADKLPRALGISATLNEVTYVLAPVAASGLGTVSPVFSILVLAVLSAVPAVLVPHVRAAQVETAPGPDASVLTPAILLWLMCAAGGGAVVASIEIGAVALALEFGYRPALAILFTVPLCLASVTGGVWISIRNRTPSRRAVVLQLGIMAVGAALAALQISLSATIVGAVLIGSVLAPLATYYSLVLDTLAPPSKRPEVFALLRTSNAVGVIFASAVLTAVSIEMALIVVAALMLVVTLTVGTVSLRQGETAAGA